MVAIFLDGESKSGKTAVGRHMKVVLENSGYTARLIVAGYFFRTVALLTLRREFDENSNESIAGAVKAVLDSAELYDEVSEIELHTPQIDVWVSRIAQFDFVQAAAQGWRVKSAQKALDDGLEVALFDGRNLRAKLDDWLKEMRVLVALELIIFCRTEVAARRYLSDSGNKLPSDEALDGATAMIDDRRQMDRRRDEAAYQEPIDPIILRPGEVQATDALHDAFATDVSDPPRPILFDNSDVPLADGLATVETLATAAIENTK
jgi:cytidylate kinase